MAAGNSFHHVITSSNGRSSYDVTINYETGNFCECKGNLSLRKKWGEESGRTEGTSCRHIKQAIKQHHNGDWGTKVTGGGGRRTPAASAPSSTPPATSKPTGRRAAIMAQRARREEEKFGRRAAHKAQKAKNTTSDLSLIDRIAALEAAREGATS